MGWLFYIYILNYFYWPCYTWLLHASYTFAPRICFLDKLAELFLSTTGLTLFIWPFLFFTLLLIQSWERELINTWTQSVILNHYQIYILFFFFYKKLNSFSYLTLRKDTEVKHFKVLWHLCFITIFPTVIFSSIFQWTSCLSPVVVVFYIFVPKC